MSKLGPLANIAMNFIPGFGQLWAAYGIWGQIAKGAITGFVASGGNVKGMLVGAAVGGLSYGYARLPGKTLSEKISGLSDRFTSDVVKKGAETYSNLVKNYSGGVDAFNKDAVLNTGSGMDNLVDVGDRYAAGGPGLGSGLEGVGDYKHAGWSGLEGVQEAEDYRYAAGGPGLGSGLEDLNTPKQSLLDKVLSNDWADKLRKGTQAFAERDPEVSPTYDWTTGHTGPLQSVAANTIDAGDVNKQVGYGRDVDEQLIRSLGLKTLFEQYQASV